MLQSIEPEALEDIGAAAGLTEKPQPRADGSVRTEVGPMLAVYLPYSGRSSINEARDRKRNVEAHTARSLR